MSGNAGCNDYTGSYTVDGEKLTIGPLAATKKACGPAESAVETAFLTAMGKVATYAVSGDSLELKTAEAKVGLKFTATKPAGLSKTRWVATGVNNGKGAVSSVVIDTTLTAIFAEAGTVAGSGGCNDYNGPYTSDASTIKIGPLAATRKRAGPPASTSRRRSSSPRCRQRPSTPSPARSWSCATTPVRSRFPSGRPSEEADDPNRLGVVYTTPTRSRAPSGTWLRISAGANRAVRRRRSIAASPAPAITQKSADVTVSGVMKNVVTTWTTSAERTTRAIDSSLVVRDRRVAARAIAARARRNVANASIAGIPASAARPISSLWGLSARRRARISARSRGSTSR